MKATRTTATAAFLCLLALPQPARAMSAEEAIDAKTKCVRALVGKPDICQAATRYYQDLTSNLLRAALDKTMPADEAISLLQGIANDREQWISVRNGARFAIESIQEWLASGGRSLNENLAASIPGR